MAKGRAAIISVSVGLALILLTGMATAAERKAKLKVPEMVCASRGAVVVDAATGVAGVKSASDDPDKTILTVVFDDDKTSVDEIRKALEKAGYPVEGAPVFAE